MPDLQMPRGLEVAFAGLASILAAIGLLLILMTFPAVGTPVTNWALGIWGPDGASVNRARARLPGVNTLEFTGFEAERARISSGTVRLNFFGFLPGLSWISRLDAEDGHVAITRDSPGGGAFSLTRLRRLIDEVALSEIDMRYSRNDEVNVIRIDSAAGSLRSGTISVRASGARSTLEFEGNADASTLATLAGRLRFSGDNFADFAWVAGFAAPDTPPYDAVAAISVSANTWTIDFLPETKIGDSDISGPVTIQTGNGTALIDADLRSSNLDFDDLGIIFGIPIGVGAGETYGEEQARARRILDESGRLIPNAEIDFSRLDAVDGKVVLQADQVSDAILDIQGLRLEVEIEGRVVRAPVLQLDFAQGQLSSYVTLDGSQSPAMTTAEGQLTGVPFSNLAAEPYLKGTAFGEFKVEGRGDGFREAASNLDGRISIWSEDAELLAIVAEAAALDIFETLALLNEGEGEETYTPTRCAVVSMVFDKGIGVTDPALIDTEDRLVLVSGQVGLQEEILNLSIRSESKELSFGTLMVDVRLGGTFRSPEVSALGPETILQIGAAAALASITGGLAALPFIEVGNAEDAPCADVLARAASAREE